MDKTEAFDIGHRTSDMDKTPLYLYDAKFQVEAEIARREQLQQAPLSRF